MDLEHAVQKHMEWKVTFRTAISKRAQLDVSSIAKDDCCELGNWLHGEGKAQYGNLASHAACLNKHAAFHIEAGKVASAINAGQYAEAEAMLDAHSPFSATSSEVGVAILRLKRESGQ